MELYYAVPCGKDCKYYPQKNVKEKWKPAELYGELLENYEVSNFGGIKKNGENVSRILDIEGKVMKAGEIYVEIDGKGKVILYKIIASTFLDMPEGGYDDENGKKKSVHHRDNNSYNFNPDNMVFLDSSSHSNEPHLCRKNFDNWDVLIDKICNVEE